MECFLDGRRVDRDGVLDPPRVAAGQCDDERHIGAADGAEHQAIAAPQAVLRHPQPAELVVFVRIRAREVEHALRRVPRLEKTG